MEHGTKPGGKRTLARHLHSSWLVLEVEDGHDEVSRVEEREDGHGGEGGRQLAQLQGPGQLHGAVGTLPAAVLAPRLRAAAPPRGLSRGAASLLTGGPGLRAAAPRGAALSARAVPRRAGRRAAAVKARSRRPGVGAGASGAENAAGERRRCAELQTEEERHGGLRRGGEGAHHR